jgi:acyl carrier protein
VIYINIEQAMALLSQTADIPYEQLSLESTFDQLNIESVTFVNIVIQFEIEYEVEFEPDYFISARFANIGAFFDYVKNLHENREED